MLYSKQTTIHTINTGYSLIIYHYAFVSAITQELIFYQSLCVHIALNYWLSVVAFIYHMFFS